MKGLHEGQQLCPGALLFDAGVADIGPIKTADELARRLQLQPLNHVRPGVVVGGGRQGQTGHIGKALVQDTELQIVFAEIMPPLADAMRLIDGEHAQQALALQVLQLRHEAGVEQAFGRHVEQDPFAGHQPGLDGLGGLRGQAAVEVGRRHPQLFQGPHLVVHEGNQG